MTTALQLRRGTTAQHSTFTGANGEATVDTTKKTLVVHDGVTPGGSPLAKEADALNKVRFDISTQGLNATEQTNARTNIGAAKDPGANGWIVRNAAGNAVARSLVAGAGISITNVDGVSGNPTITNTGVRSVNGQTGDVNIAVDTSDKVSKSGDTMTGDLSITSGQLKVYGYSGNTSKGIVRLTSDNTKYLYFDGTKYVMPGADLVVNGGTVWHSGNFNATSHGVHLTSIRSAHSFTLQNVYNSGGSGTLSMSIDVYGRVTSSSLSNCNCTC